MKKISYHDLARVCRLHNSTSQAAQALGVHRNTISKLCRKYRLQTPYQRRTWTSEQREIQALRDKVEVLQRENSALTVKLMDIHKVILR